MGATLLKFGISIGVLLGIALGAIGACVVLICVDSAAARLGLLKQRRRLVVPACGLLLLALPSAVGVGLGSLSVRSGLVIYSAVSLMYLLLILLLGNPVEMLLVPMITACICVVLVPRVLRTEMAGRESNRTEFGQADRADPRLVQTAGRCDHSVLPPEFAGRSGDDICTSSRPREVP